MNASLVAFNQRKVLLVGAFSAIVKSSRTFVCSSTGPGWAGGDRCSTDTRMAPAPPRPWLLLARGLVAADHPPQLIGRGPPRRRRPAPAVAGLSWLWWPESHPPGSSYPRVQSSGWAGSSTGPVILHPMSV